MNPKPQNSLTHSLIFRHQEVVQLFQHKSDLEVWNAFNHGDERAFNFIYRVYTPLLYRFGLNLCKDGDLVKDSIQNMFIYLRSKRGSLAEIKNLKAYLYKVLQHEIFKEAKKHDPQAIPKNLEEGFQIEFSPETQLIAREEASLQNSRFRLLVNQLTQKQRKAILLLFEENLSYKEIADLLNLNEPKTARKLIYRALSSLKTIITNKN